MYNQKILDIFKNPANAGGLQGANGVYKNIDSTFGDVVKLYLKINENEVIEQAKFKTMGSVVSIAASNVIADLVVNKTLEEAKLVSSEDVLEVLGIVPSERLCLVKTVADTLTNAIQDYYKRKEKEQRAQKN